MPKYTKKATAKKVYKKKPMQNKKRLVNLIKTVTAKQSETKNVPSSHSKIELYHNSGATGGVRQLHAPIELDGVNQMPAQGISDTQRIGDSIDVRGIKVRLLLGQKLDRHNVTFKIVVIKCSTGYVPSLSQMFDNQTGNIMLDSLNTDRLKVVYHKYIKHVINPDLSGVGGADKEYTFFHRFYLSTPRKLTFTADTGKDYDKYKHYLYVFCYDSFGTLVTDNLAYVQGYSNLYYKDP